MVILENMNKYFYCLTISTLLLFFSCSKDSVQVVSTSPQLRISVQATTFESEALPVANAKSNLIQQVEIPLDKNNLLAVSIRTKDKTAIQQIASTNKAATTKSPLTVGTRYKMLVFNASNVLVEMKDFTVGNELSEETNLSVADAYSFIFYSLGTTTLPTMNISLGDPLAKVVGSFQGNEDLMVDIKQNLKLTGGENTIAVVLRHIFTQVKTTLNVSTVGTIETIGDLSITNTYSKADFSFANISQYPKNITFSSVLNSLTLPAFKIDATKTMATSDARILFADGTLAQSLVFKELKVNGIVKNNLKVDGFKLLPGVSYTIDLQIKKFSPEGFVIGNILWGSGNLILKNGVYEQAASQGEYGDYWYRKSDGSFFVTPLLSNSSGEGSGATLKDLCTQLGGNWRLPTQDDVSKLETYASWSFNTKKFVGTYVNKANEKVNGVYMGTTSQPAAADQDKYLFLPFAGAYNTNSAAGIKTEGYYWHTGLGVNNEGTSYQFASGYMSAKNNGGLDSRRANTIRCVKTVN